MAYIHHTTMVPSKLDLLAEWLPRQPWYRGAAHPVLVRRGGFRLDDPAGEVGIEVLLVAEGEVTYGVPLTYRGAELDGAGDGLIGASEHGVLGRRWVYDAAHDPVAVAQLLALVQGEAVAQHQNDSDTPDPTVSSRWSGGRLAPVLPLVVSHRPGRTGVLVTEQGVERLLELVRVVEPVEEEVRGEVRVPLHGPAEPVVVVR